MLSVPILLWSSIGRDVLGFTVAAPFGLRDDVWLLLLSLPVVFYSAWIFFDGAARALRARTLDMMVLVAVAIGAGWLYSLVVTLTGGGDTFYEAATVLAAFVLLGHWFEMRARGGANDAIRTLLDLAPPRAAAVERESEHPLAEAVVTRAEDLGVPVARAEEFENVPGHGALARVDGQKVAVGNARLMAREGIDLGTLAGRREEMSSAGRTVVCVAVDGRAAALIGIADAPRPTSAAAVSTLAEAGAEVVMLTGDNEATARRIAGQLGVRTVIAEVLPGEKASKIAGLQKPGTKVAMVGDGVNDAPALAAADLGIAIGAGTDVAIETADVVLMRSDPLDIPTALAIGRGTLRKMRQNLGWAIGYNSVALPIAAGVFEPAFGLVLRPEIAALSMSGSSFLVAVDALLLRKLRLPSAAADVP